MAENRGVRLTCRVCKGGRYDIGKDGLCPPCAERFARPDVGPGGRPLAPAVSKRCWWCNGRFITTRPERTMCTGCEKAGAFPLAEAEPKPEWLAAALVAWHAILQARGLPCDHNPGGRLAWLMAWGLAFPDSGASADDTARQHIRATLDSVGRLDLLAPARRKAR